MTAEPTPRSPYVGPRPFEQNDADLFFGREGEMRELLSYVVANRVVLFYAASGAGKTSLLNAGVIRLLEHEERFEVLPIARFRRLTADEAQDAGPQNVYVAATLLNWTSKADDEPSPERLKEFLDSLPPKQDPRGRRLPRAVLFDQFEELFTVYPEFWEQREEFFAQLGEALEADPYLHVVLALREDYLAHLDPYLRLLPPVTRFRLERLGPDAALHATEDPLETTGRRFAPGVAEDLVTDLRELRVDTGRGESVEVQGEFVEPVHLQVVCHNLWSALPPDVPVIDAEHKERFGDVDEVLSRFYSEAVVSAAAAAGVGEGELRERLEEGFITPIGTRDSQFFGPEETARIPNAAIKELEKRHLLRGEEKGLARRLELTHDRLIEPIRQSNDLYRAGARRKRRRRLFVAGLAIAAVAGAAITLAAVDREAHAPEERATFRQPKQQVLGAAFSPDGRFVVTASEDGTARVWNWGSEPPARVSAMTPAVPQALNSAGFSPDGRFVVTAGDDGTARIWDWQSNPPARVSVLRHAQPLFGAAFSPDGRFVVTASEDGTARVWDWRLDPPARVSAMTPGVPQALKGAGFSRDGRFVVTAGDDGTARIWDWQSNPPARVSVLRHAQPLFGAAFSPDGRFVVTSGTDGIARVWDVEREGVTVVLRGPTQTPIPSGVFSPDGTLVVTASQDGTARVWAWTSNPDAPTILRLGNLDDQEPGRGVQVEDQPLSSATFSPDSKLVATASLDGTVRVWDLRRG